MIDTPTTSANPYDVLQVQRTAMPEVVRAAYRALAWKFHPDRGESSDRMVAINAAWQILGDPARRAAYDAAASVPMTAPVVSPTPRSTDIDVAPAREHGLAPRRREHDGAGTGPGTVIDFGRYIGWTIGKLAVEDPDYLRWLARTPVGRRLAPEIDSALAGRDLQAQTMAPRPAPAKRSLFASLGARG